MKTKDFRTLVAEVGSMTAVQRNALMAALKSKGSADAVVALEMVSRGRFEKSEPTIHHGQDLDLPTYLRRGVALT